MSYESDVLESNKYFESMESNSRTGPSFAKEGTKKTNRHYNSGCHYYMGAAHGDIGIKTVVSSLYRSGNLDNKIAEKYWQWLIFGDDSPYRKVTKGAEVLFCSDESMIAVRIPAEDESPRLIVNFLVATRMPMEYPFNVSTWYDLVEAGLSGVEAYYMQNFIKFHGNETHKSYYGGHYPLNRQVSFAKFKEADPVPKDAPISKTSIYTPNNVIWDNGKLSQYRDDIYKHLKVDSVYKYLGSFPALYKAVVTAGDANNNQALGRKVLVIKKVLENRAELFA